MKPFLICTCLGLAISAAGWFLPPPYLTSTGLLSVRGLEAPTRSQALEQRMATATQGLRSREILVPLIRSFNLYPGVPLDEAVATMQRDIVFERVLLGPSQAIAVSFRYRLRDEAQGTVGWLMQQITRTDRGFRLIDPASRPTDSTEDYRLAARFLGLPVGVIAGLILGWRRRRLKFPTEILPAT